MNDTKTVIPVQQKPGGEPAVDDRKELIYKEIRDMIGTAPTAENYVVFLKHLERLLTLPAAEQDEVVRAASHIAAQRFGETQLAQLLKKRAICESTCSTGWQTTIEQIGRIEAQLERRDLTRVEQLALKLKLRRCLRVLILAQKPLTRVIAEQLKLVSNPTTEKK